MQRIFTEYKQPFALSYLGISLMVVHLPISVFKEWICSLLKNLCRNLHKNYSSVTISSGLSDPLGIDEIHLKPETSLKSYLFAKEEISEREKGMPFLVKKDEDKPDLLAGCEFNSWKITVWLISHSNMVCIRGNKISSESF